MGGSVPRLGEVLAELLTQYTARGLLPAMEESQRVISISSAPETDRPLLSTMAMLSQCCVVAD